jgi:hypothetical protein
MRPREADIDRALQDLIPLARDVFGNQLTCPVVDPAWLRWNEGTISRWALSVYNGRAFDELPVLADAFEEAGCIDARILGHLRGPGPHVRGCWVLDLALGRA